MEALQRITLFVGGYLATVFWQWWTLAFVLFALNEMSEWLFKKSLRWIHEKRVLVVVSLIFIAQAVAYKDLSDKHDLLREKSSQSAPQPILPVPYRLYDEREWPPLSSEQIAEWVRALTPFPIKEIRVFWGSEVEAKRLFRSLQEIGKQLKYPVSAPAGYADKPEISIYTGRNDPAGPVLQKLFRDYQMGETVPVILEGLEGGEGIQIYLPECPQRQALLRINVLSVDKTYRR